MEDRTPDPSEKWKNPTPTLPDTESKRITAEDAEKSQAEKEAAMSKLMDEMEASVETQGQYFIRLGDKVRSTEETQQEHQRIFGLGRKTMGAVVETGIDDRRVLILNALEDGGSDRNRYREVTMVTRDGIKTVRMPEHPQQGIDNFGPAYNIIKNLKSGARPSREAGFSVLESGNRHIALGYMTEDDKRDNASFAVSDFSGAIPFGGTPEDFQGLVKKSIDQTESPHKRVVEKNTAEAQIATSASGFIQSLPPRA